MTALLLWEHISQTITIHAHHIKHKIFIATHGISKICQTVWKQNMHTCYATRYQACRTALDTLYTTWHTAWCYRHTVDQTHDINQTQRIRDCYRDATWEHRRTTNMSELIDDRLQHVACTPTSTTDDHNKRYNHAMTRANSRTITTWMLNYIMSCHASFTTCTGHKVTWAHPHRNNHLTCQQMYQNHWHSYWHYVYRNINWKLCYLSQLKSLRCTPESRHTWWDKQPVHGMGS